MGGQQESKKYGELVAAADLGIVPVTVGGPRVPVNSVSFLSNRYLLRSNIQIAHHLCSCHHPSLDISYVWTSNNMTNAFDTCICK